MMYRVKEEYRGYKMSGDEKASAINLDVDQPVEVLRHWDNEVGGSHCIRYHHIETGGKVFGYMDIDMLEEWK